MERHIGTTSLICEIFMSRMRLLFLFAVCCPFSLGVRSTSRYMDDNTSMQGRPELASHHIVTHDVTKTRTRDPQDPPPGFFFFQVP